MWTWVLIGILLWVVVPLPLALLVGRLIRAGSAATTVPDAPATKPVPAFRRIVIRRDGRAETTTSSTTSARQP